MSLITAEFQSCARTKLQSSGLIAGFVSSFESTMQQSLQSSGTGDCEPLQENTLRLRYIHAPLLRQWLQFTVTHTHTHFTFHHQTCILYNIKFRQHIHIKQSASKSDWWKRNHLIDWAQPLLKPSDSEEEGCLRNELESARGKTKAKNKTKKADHEDGKVI